MPSGGSGSGGMSTGGMSAGGMGDMGGRGNTGGRAAGGASAGLGGSAGGGAGGMAGSAGGGGSSESAGCGKTRTLMNGRKTIMSGGNREYILRVPDSYDNTHPYRLIMAYHWLNGNADQVANGGGSTEDPYYGLWDLAENSTIFVAPEGLNAGWANSGGADVTLTDAILEQVQNDLCIDKTRIFATGFSYGAGMSYALACARANVFRGVALYAGAQLSGCSGGTTPIAYFHAHGVNDSVLSISGGRQLRDKFVMVNGCTAMNPTDPAGNSGTHTCTSYQGCSEGHPVRWCAHGGDHNPTEKDQGQSKSWIPGEAWAFIEQF
jgi:poly(3-hydroxybutyrate) depolymerase